MQRVLGSLDIATPYLIALVIGACIVLSVLLCPPSRLQHEIDRAGHVDSTDATHRAK